MKNLFVFILLIMVLTIGCSSSEINEDQAEIKTFNEILENNNATVGEVLKIMRTDTEYKNTDDSYIVLNFTSIFKYETYILNNNQILENSVVIENVTNISVTNNFINGAGYFSLIDEYGHEFFPEVWTQSGAEYSEIILVLDEQSDFNSVKYLLVGGFDRTKNDGKDKKIFKFE